MTTDSIRQNTADLLASATNLEAALSHHEWESALWHEKNEGKPPPDCLVEREAELQPQFAAMVRSLYLAAVCLMDAMALHEYLKRFSAAFEVEFFDKSFQPNEAALTFAPADDWPPYPQSVFLSKIRAFLFPLGVDVDGNVYHQQAGIRYLENILESTAAILQLRKVSPISEPKISRAVRDVVELVFPSARNPRPGSFSRVLKNYVPDILIPELHAAVEYKLIRKRSEFDAALAGIADDVGGYTGDSQYKLFFAVFYFDGYALSRARFLAAWKEKNFPKEWVAVYAV